LQTFLSPPDSCHDCVVRRQALFTPLNKADLQNVQKIRKTTRFIKAGDHIVPTQNNLDQYLTIYTGWAMRCRSTQDGHTQIIAFLLPGAFVDTSFEMANGDQYWVEAITDVFVCVFPGESLRQKIFEIPTLSKAFTALVQREEAVLMEHLTDIGRRDAVIGLAHFLLETFARLKLLGQVDDNSCPFPLKQRHLADALGLSIEHVNRTIQDLRRRKWISLGEQRLHVLNMEAMEKFCDFDPGYLTPRPII